jgi:hypothetical protein
MYIKNENFVIKFESRPKTLPQYLQIALTAVATVHIGKITEYIS